MLKGVIFDLDDTLYDFKTIDPIAISEVCEYGAKLVGVSHDDFMEAYAYGKQKIKAILPEVAAIHNRIFYLQFALEYLKVNPYERAVELNDYYWERFMEKITPFPGVVETLTKLKEKNIQTSLCTDMLADKQFRKMKVLGLDSLMTHMVSSEEVGIEKPGKMMFLRALEKLGTAPAETLMVGDNLKKDIMGAQSVGIRGLWRSEDTAKAKALKIERFMSYDEPVWQEILK